MDMVEITVPVLFTGTVTVKVPKSLDKTKRQEFLAEKIALCQITAVVKKPDDCAEAFKAACQEFLDFPFATAEHFDASEATQISGNWEKNKDIILDHNNGVVEWVEKPASLTVVIKDYDDVPLYDKEDIKTDSDGNQYGEDIW